MAGALIGACGGYRLLFLAAAAISLIGAPAVHRITSVR